MTHTTRHHIVGAALLLAATGAHGQQTDAIVTEESTVVEVSSNRSYTVSYHSEVLLLNERAASLASFGMQLNKDNTLEAFSETLTDATGRTLRKVKKSELQRTEYSPELAADYYYLYLDVEPPVYPVTVTTDYRRKASDNVLAYPVFAPQRTCNQRVGHASYQITAPADQPVQWATTATAIQPRTSTDEKGHQQLTFELHDLEPIAREPLSLPLEELLPTVRLAPASFSYHGTQGSLASWEALGQWAGQLLEQRDLLTDEAKRQILAMTDTCTTTRSKIAVLYNYLGRTTRYVSIQLGIGGFQPLTADFVWRNGFGDCKALTNYMKAMLHVVGVKANYTLISTEYATLLPMANFQQLNHVVLEVPLPTDTLWLECTNPEEPLGYVPRHMAGHQAIELSGGSGRLVTLPDYADAQNLRHCDVTVQLQADGQATVSIDDDYQQHQYWNAKRLARLGRRELTEAVNTRYLLPQSDVAAVSVDDLHTAYTPPHARIHVEATSHKYAKATGQRLFVPVSPLHKDFTPMQADEHRQQGLCIRRGSRTVDDIELQVPEGYSVETLPQGISMEQPFGSFTSTVEADGATIRISNMLTYRHGQYDASLAPAMREFESKVAAQYRARVVLKKN